MIQTLSDVFMLVASAAYLPWWVVRPRVLFCDCGLDKWPCVPVHYREPLMLAHAVIHAMAAVLVAVTSGPLLLIVWAPMTALLWWEWWVHSKNNRKKLAEKALGVVKATAAGLKVVPEPGGAPA